ncbi:MAG: helicase-associated domain-containing protein [Anaerolineae bacterium]|nr:helicase-associated domain-containing protein [Anaerolineae bacterium]
MQSLARTLAEYDLELLRVIANRWDVGLPENDVPAASQNLAAAMLTPDKVVAIWGKLPDEQRMALQTLLGAKGKMPLIFFTKTYGEIRSFGPDKLVREKPHLNPASIAEALFFRGLIAKGFDRAKPESQPIAVIYVPYDLAPLLPSTVNSYSGIAAQKPVNPLPTVPENAKLADTSLVDDLTTLLAICELNDIRLQNGAIPPEIRANIKKHLMGTGSAAHFALMISLALDMGVMEITGGLLKPKLAEAQSWLDVARPIQVRELVKTWIESTTFNELWLLPGIKPEKASWQNDPRLARKAVIEFLEVVPAGAWYPVDEVIEAIKEDDPAFQRPGGDFESWFIRDAETNQYLRGLASWDKVDGATLRFILIGVMHGLGLVDITSDAGAFRLTRYGQSLPDDLRQWPQSGVPDGTPVVVHLDGLCEAPRATNRFERFQLARITEWVSVGSGSSPYQYRLTAQSIEQARAHNLRSDHIINFLRRATEQKVPEVIIKQIETWDQGSVQTSEPAIMQQLIILRLPTPELLSRILNDPEMRRFTGAALGPTTVVVRDDHWQSLVEALEAAGIPVKVEGEGEDEDEG